MKCQEHRNTQRNGVNKNITAKETPVKEPKVTYNPRSLGTDPAKIAVLGGIYVWPKTCMAYTAVILLIHT